MPDTIGYCKWAVFRNPEYLHHRPYHRDRDGHNRRYTSRWQDSHIHNRPSRARYRAGFLPAVRPQITATAVEQEVIIAAVDAHIIFLTQSRTDALVALVIGGEQILVAVVTDYLSYL